MSQNILVYVKSTGQVDTKNQKKGSDRPRNPPSIFERAPKSYLPQTLVSAFCNVPKREIDFDSRSSNSKKQKVDKNVK